MPFERTLRKHVAIIHAYSLMSALQRKILNILLYETMYDKSVVRNNDSTFLECRMALSKLVSQIGFDSKNTKYLKEAIDSLASLKIEWNLLKDKVPSEISFLNLRVLHGSPTFYQDGTFNFSFHKVMLNLVENPAIYGSIDIDLQSLFESKYSHSLYENSTRFENLQKNKVIQLDTFKKLLGVKPNSYPSVKEFTRSVISPAVEEVNDRADFVLNLEGVKFGKRLGAYEIKVYSKKQSKKTDAKDFVENKKLLEEIFNTFGAINENLLKNVIKSYSQEYIKEKIEYTKKFSKKETTGLYPIPYFVSAIKNNYTEKNSNHVELEISSSKEKNNWFNEMKMLNLELIHWEKCLSLADQKNEALVNSYRKYIHEYKEKIKKHYQIKPKDQV